MQRATALWVCVHLRDFDKAERDQVALDFPELVIVCGHIGYPWTAEMIAVADLSLDDGVRSLFLGDNARRLFGL